MNTSKIHKNLKPLPALDCGDMSPLSPSATCRGVLQTPPFSPIAFGRLDVGRWTLGCFHSLHAPRFFKHTDFIPISVPGSESIETKPATYNFYTWDKTYRFHTDFIPISYRFHTDFIPILPPTYRFCTDFQAPPRPPHVPSLEPGAWSREFGRWTLELLWMLEFVLLDVFFRPPSSAFGRLAVAAFGHFHLFSNGRPKHAKTCQKRPCRPFLPVAQRFLSVGSRDIPVPRFPPAVRQSSGSEPRPTQTHFTTPRDQKSQVTHYMQLMKLKSRSSGKKR